MTPPPKTMGQTDNCAQAQYNHLTENTALLIACIQDNHANEHLQRSIHHPVDQIHLQVDPSPHVRCLNNKYDIQYATCQDVNNWVVVEKYNKHLECTHTHTHSVDVGRQLITKLSIFNCNIITDVIITEQMCVVLCIKRKHVVLPQYMVYSKCE